MRFLSMRIWLFALLIGIIVIALSPVTGETILPVKEVSPKPEFQAFVRVDFEELSLRNREVTLKIQISGEARYLGGEEAEEFKTLGHVMAIGPSPIFNVTCRRLDQQSVFADAIFIASLRISSEMMLYPHDKHSTSFKVGLMDLTFDSVEKVFIDHLPDFEILTGVIEPQKSENNMGILRFDILIERDSWSQAYLLMPVFAFYCVLLATSLVKPEKGDLSKQLTVVLSVITFGSITLYNLYNLIPHFTGPTLLETYYLLLLVESAFTIIWGLTYGIENKNAQRIRFLVLFAPLIILFLLFFVVYCNWIKIPSLASVSFVSIGILLLVVPLLQNRNY